MTRPDGPSSQAGWLIGLVVVIALGLGGWWWMGREPDSSPSAVPVPSRASAAPERLRPPVPRVDEAQEGTGGEAEAETAPTSSGAPPTQEPEPAPVAIDEGADAVEGTGGLGPLAQGPCRAYESAACECPQQSVRARLCVTARAQIRAWMSGSDYRSAQARCEQAVALAERECTMR